MNENIDPRKQRSKVMMRDALVALMQNYNAHVISIRQLTEKAQLNRSTFYLHYLNMPDFLQKVSDEMIEGLLHYIYPSENPSLRIIQDKQIIYYTRYFEYIQLNAAFFKAMLGENGLPEFRFKLIDAGILRLLTSFRPYFEQLEQIISPPVFVNYIISAHIGLVDYWLKTDMKYSVGYMAQQINKLTVLGLFTAVNIKVDNIEIPR